MTALLAPVPALDHCYYADGGFTVVKRVTPGYAGVHVLETLVQAARRALGSPDLVLSAVDHARLRTLPTGTVLTLRPTITATDDGCTVTTDEIALRCARSTQVAYPATLVLASFTRKCDVVLARDGRGPAEPLRLRGVRVLGAVRAGQAVAHTTTLRPDGSISGGSAVDGRPVLAVDRLEAGEARTTG